MRTMTREGRAAKKKPRTVCLRAGDRFSSNGINYCVPSAEILRDIEDFEEGRVELLRFSCSTKDMFRALEAE